MSNYELMKRRMAVEFLKYDQGRMIERFSLENDPDYLYLAFVSRSYRIARSDGRIEWGKDGFTAPVEAGYNEAMTIYDVLCCAKEGCSLSGEFVDMNRLSAVRSSGTVGGGMFQDQADFFDSRAEALARACERLGGVPFGRADVSYRLPLFSFFPIILQFWNSDDEFPAGIHFLFDKNALQYMRFETTWFAVSHLLKRIEEEMEEFTLC